MAQGKGPNTQVNKLDNMLGSLQSDLHKLGVKTVAKGVCGACCKPIVGQVRSVQWYSFSLTLRDVKRNATHICYLIIHSHLFNSSMKDI